MWTKLVGKWNESTIFFFTHCRCGCGCREGQVLGLTKAARFYQVSMTKAQRSGGVGSALSYNVRPWSKCYLPPYLYS